MEKLVKRYGMYVDGTLVKTILSDGPERAQAYFAKSYAVEFSDYDWDVAEIKARRSDEKFYYSIREIEPGKRYTNTILQYKMITLKECKKRFHASSKPIEGKQYRIVELTEWAERDVEIILK